MEDPPVRPGDTESPPVNRRARSGPGAGGRAATPERPRADARRNRQALLAVAVSMLARSDDEVSLEAIAREAGVGIGTLYRHFPTRQSLVVEAYAGEIGLVCDAAAGLLTTLPADVALREWMQWFVDYVAAKRDMPDALQAVVDSGSGGLAALRHRIVAALATLVEAGQEAGEIRGDIDPEDVLGALRGVWMASGDRHRPDRARRLLNLLMDGLRLPPGAASPGGAPGDLTDR